MGGELNRINPTVVEGAEDIMGAEDASFKADTFKFNWNERNQNPRNRPARRMTEKQFSDLQRMQRMGRSMGFRAEGMGQKMSKGQFEALRRMVQQQQSGRSVIRGDMSRMLRRDLRRAEYLGNMEYMQGRILEDERRKNRDAKDSESFEAQAGSGGILYDDDNHGSMVLKEGWTWLEGSPYNEVYYGNCDSCSEDLNAYHTGYVVDGTEWSICVECFDKMPGRGGVIIQHQNGNRSVDFKNTYNAEELGAESQYEYWCSYCGDSGPKTSSPQWCKTYENNGGAGYHSQMCGTCYDAHDGLCYYCESGDDYRAETFEANETDANMVSEGSVDAFYGGGAKVSVSSAGIQPTANPSVDEAFDVGNQVGLDVAEQEVMNENPSVEVNYGAENDDDDDDLTDCQVCGEMFVSGALNQHPTTLYTVCYECFENELEEDDAGWVDVEDFTWDEEDYEAEGDYVVVKRPHHMARVRKDRAVYDPQWNKPNMHTDMNKGGKMYDEKIGGWVDMNFDDGDVVDLTQELASKVGFRLGSMSASALVLGVAALAGYRYARR